MDSKIRKQILQLEKAIKNLKEVLESQYNPVTRDAAIKRFDYTFELTWKLAKEIANYEGLKVASPRNAIRVAGQLGLIDDVSKWLDYLNAKNDSIYTYHEEVANFVYNKAKEFYKDATKIVKRIKIWLEKENNDTFLK